MQGAAALFLKLTSKAKKLSCHCWCLIDRMLSFFFFLSQTSEVDVRSFLFFTSSTRYYYNIMSLSSLIVFFFFPLKSLIVFFSPPNASMLICWITIVPLLLLVTSSRGNNSSNKVIMNLGLKTVSIGHPTPALVWTKKEKIFRAIPGFKRLNLI